MKTYQELTREAVYGPGIRFRSEKKRYLKSICEYIKDKQSMTVDNLVKYLSLYSIEDISRMVKFLEDKKIIKIDRENNTQWHEMNCKLYYIND